jgi:AraC-like DNA-binding protein
VFQNMDIAITRIDLVITVRPGGAQLKHRNRKNHGLVYKLSGQTAYHFGNETVITNPDSILYLPKGSNYDVEPGSSGECIAVNFDVLEDLFLDARLFQPDNHEVFLDLFNRLEKEWLYKKTAYQAKCKSILYSLIALLQQYNHSLQVPASKLNRIRRAVAYLEDHYADETLDIGLLAGQCSMSEAYFRRCFKEIYALSPIRYINMIRINRAKDLLNAGSLPVSEIAGQVGFTDIFYFSKAFKKEVGCSPSSYRNEQD